MPTDASPRKRWRVPLILLGVLLLAVSVPVALVATNAPAPAPLAPLGRAHRARLIPLPDGTEETLGDLVDGRVAPGDAPPRTREVRGADGVTVVLTIPTPDRHDIVSVARYHLMRGDVELAEELFRRTPSSHPRWADAQRWLGWHVYSDGKGDPARGVPHVNAALVADPLNGNAWQDAARTYAEAFGVGW